MRIVGRRDCGVEVGRLHGGGGARARSVLYVVVVVEKFLVCSVMCKQKTGDKSGRERERETKKINFAVLNVEGAFSHAPHLILLP